MKPRTRSSSSNPFKARGSDVVHRSSPSASFMAYASPLLIQRGMNSHPATGAQYTHLLHGLDSLLFPTHNEPKAIPDPETDSIPMLCSLFGDPLDSACPGQPNAKEGAHLGTRGTTRKGAGIMKLKVNGEAQELSDLDPATPLLWVLRDRLQLVGAKYGCGIGQCGACTVLLEGQPVRSCSVSVGGVGDGEIRTIEGLAESPEKLHPVQEAWIEEDVAQCGYCQAGQIMAATALLEKNPTPSDTEIDAAMAGNLCRCGTYLRIRSAIKRASEKTFAGTAKKDREENA